MSANENHPNGEPEDESLRIDPPARQRVADHVFDTLAKAIVGGELKPGEPLATQGELAKRFNVSALVVRQAIHRLEDLSLVRVRQGSATIILDPAESTDIRLIQLRMELAGADRDGRALAADALENQLLFLVPLLALAERHISHDQLVVLDYIVDRAEQQELSPEVMRRCLIEFWTQIAKATRNTVFQQQVRWWSSIRAAFGGRGRQGPDERKAMLQFLRSLIESLRDREGTVDKYLRAIGPTLEWLDRQRGFERGTTESATPEQAEPPGLEVEPERPATP